MAGKTKNFLQRLGLAAAIFAGYGLLYTQFDTSLIKALSKKKEFVSGIDFEAYNNKENVTITLKKGKELSYDKKEITNWPYYVGIEDIMAWYSLSYSNALGFTPYYSNIETAYQSELKEKSALEIIAGGDRNIKILLEKAIKPNIVILKVKDDPKIYEKLGKEDPLTFITERIAKNALDYDKKVVIELETPDDGKYEAHKNRTQLIKNINSNFKVATTLEKSDDYNEETGIWDPEKSRKYWEDSDIIIIEDYFSKPSDLEKSLQEFKSATKGTKQVWVRVIVGEKRVNQRGLENLEEELKVYEHIFKIVKDNSDGCLVSDGNGTWLFSSQSYDQRETLKRIKQMYKAFRKIKIERTYSYGGSSY